MASAEIIASRQGRRVEVRSPGAAGFDDPAFTTFVAEYDGLVVGSAVGCAIEASSSTSASSGRRTRAPRLRGRPAGGAWARNRSGARRGCAPLAARRRLPDGRHRSARDEPAGGRTWPRPGFRPPAGGCTARSPEARHRASGLGGRRASRAFSQSSLNWTMPLSVSGWWTICWRTLNGSVAMCAPASAAWVMWSGLRIEAARTSDVDLVDREDLGQLADHDHPVLVDVVEAPDERADAGWRRPWRRAGPGWP